MSVLDVDARLRRGGFALAARFAAPLDGVTTVFGPSGSGKSMLLSCIAGLARLDAGHVVLNGRTLEDASRKLRTPPADRRVGVVFQDARLFPHLSVSGNLDFAARRVRDRAALLTPDDAARRLDIAPLMDRVVRNLSGGERSRVAMARALCAAPELLLLDEPFAALDGRRRRAFVVMLAELSASLGLPMLAVTHQIEDAAELGANIVLMRAGEAVFCGTLDEMARRPDLRALFDDRDVGVRIAAARLADGARASGGAWVRADNVLLAKARPHGLSARHVWEGRVVDVTAEETGGLLVSLETAAGYVLSRITRDAWADLALAPDAAAWAVVKTHAI
jgi:molybdate transport system ATP-binding protein